MTGDEQELTYREELERLWVTAAHAAPQLDGYRAEVLREAADMADPDAPEVSVLGDAGRDVAAWLRMIATPPTAARTRLDDMNDDQLDQLYARLDRYADLLRAYADLTARATTALETPDAR